MLMRSATAAIRNSSSEVPPSSLFMVLRWNAVAIFWLSVGFGSRSPAICSMVNWSKGMSALRASMT